VLDEWGLECFHMTDFANRVRLYESWSDQERRFRLARLIAIINRHTLASIAIVVPVKSYNSIFSAEGKRFVGGPYGVAANACFMDVAKVVEPDYPSARIAYIFEAGAQGAGEVQKVFGWNFNNPENKERFKLLSLKFAGKEFVPLQAADILAYELGKHLPRQLGIDRRSPRHENLSMLQDCKLKSWGYLDETQLTEQARIIEAAVRTHGFNRKPFRATKQRGTRPRR
jgi:hypothetical protein